MKRLLNLGNEYIKESDWKDLALIKLCLCSMGIIIGMHIAPKYKKRAAAMSMVIFAATYIPLMAKFFKIAMHGRK